MPIQRIDGLPSAYDAGDATGDYIKKAADAAANAACGLYRDYPGFVLPPDVFNLAPSVVAASRGIWDSLCGGRGELPAPPQKPFDGGQCDGIKYRVTFQLFDGSGNLITVGTTATLGLGNRFGNVWGAVKGATLGRSGSISVVQMNCRGLSTNAILPQGNYTIGGQNPPGTAKVVITNVVPQANQPADSCGNPPPSYPFEQPPAGRTSGNTTITNNDGTDVTIPFAYIPVTPTLELSPNIRVDLGGLNFQFDLGGVSVNIPDLAPSAPGTPEFPGGGGNQPDCPPCPGTTSRPAPGDPELIADETEPTPGKEEDRPGIRYLEVILTKLPDKVQFGSGGQNAVFAGWIAFRAKSGGYHPRQQINFQQSVFEAPEGSDGYTITLTNGAQGRVREYTEQPET